MGLIFKDKGMICACWVFFSFFFPFSLLFFSSLSLSPFVEVARQEKIDLATAEGPPEKYTKRGDSGNGGWTTRRSHDGLIRRLLHAMMTSDASFP